jgi:hypothetical protein
MNDDARTFLKRLEVHEASIAEEIAADNFGAGLLTALKEFDFYHYNLVRSGQSDETSLHFHMLQFGLPRLIAEIFSRIPAFRYPVFTFQSRKELILAALDATAGLGFIENGRRLAHAALAGECEIRTLENDSFEILLPKTMFALEHHELIIEQHYRQQYGIQMDAMIAAKFSKRVRKRISKLLRKNVFVFRDHFIGYGAHPELDDYFFSLAYLEMMNRRGFDEFHSRLKFGGVSFHKYVLTAVYFLSLAMKHERFCEALLQKTPEIRLRDILMITADKREFNESLLTALNSYGPNFAGFSTVTSEEVEIILKVMSVRRDNLDVLHSTMAPIPFLIEFSDSTWAQSNAGAQIAPMDFLLNSLRVTFPADYDRNQQTREKSMQRALRRVLSEALPEISFLDAVKIRGDGRILTDIDFTAIDEISGNVILFQLKHQDRYGADMRRRSNRLSKLKQEVSDWLETVRRWVRDTPLIDIASTLQLSKGAQPKQVYIVVLTKNFAHILSEIEMSEDAAYATWVQFIDALTRIKLDRTRQASVQYLFETLQQYMSHRVVNILTNDTDDMFKVRSLEYRIRQTEEVETI